MHLFIFCFKLVKISRNLFLGNYRELAEYVSKANETLVKNAAHLDTVLETLNIQEHSLGVLSILCVKYTLPVATNQTDNKFNQAKEFILNCNGEQIRFAPEACKFYQNSLFPRLTFSLTYNSILMQIKLVILWK